MADAATGMGLIESISEPALHVEALQPGGAAEWQAVLSASPTGTLFHALDFLSYHPAGRFDFHHLLIKRGHAIAAVIPGGFAAAQPQPVWRSPLGASIGGLVLPARTRVVEALAIVEALQEHARQQQWARVEITVPPTVYHPESGDLVGFALFRGGFREDHRWLCPMIDLQRVGSEAEVEAVFERRQVQSLRAALRRGATAAESGVEGLAEFAPLFAETYQRHGSQPTHTIDEIADLMRRFPDRITLVLARQDAEVIAGLLVMRLTDTVATTFYICSSNAHSQASGALVAIRELLRTLRTQGYRWLDLGPSASDTAMNPGVMFFKEGLGGVGYARSQWSWRPANGR